MKVLDGRWSSGARYHRFVAEVRFLIELRGESGVMPILDQHVPERPSDRDPAWYAMPVATPIRDHLADAHLESVVRAVADVAETLAALATRAEPTYHRDIKPDNLFWLNGRAVVGDWGLVDRPGNLDLTQEGEKIGPTFFIAPEMLQGKKDADSGPADVYSLGKTLWVLGTGQTYPIPGELRLAYPPVLLSTYRRHERAYLLDRLIDRATRNDPGERLSMAEVRDELRAWLTPPREADVVVDLGELAAQIESKTASDRAAWEELQSRLALAVALEARLVERLRTLIPTLQAAGVINCVAGHGNSTERVFRDYWPDEPIMTEFRIFYAALTGGGFGQPHIASGFAFDVVHGGPVRLVAGHFVNGALNGKSELVWRDGRKFPLGSAQEEVAIADLMDGLAGTLAQALEAFIRVA